MTHIDFFKKQAKLLLKDCKQRKQEHFAYNVKELFYMYSINPHEQPTLMKAQHLLALALGRKSWSELINDSEERLEYTRNAFLTDVDEERALQLMWGDEEQDNTDIQYNGEKGYDGLVECLHCGQRFPIDKPNHLPSCDGEDWDLIPVE